MGKRSQGRTVLSSGEGRRPGLHSRASGTDSHMRVSPRIPLADSGRDRLPLSESVRTGQDCSPLPSADRPVPGSGAAMVSPVMIASFIRRDLTAPGPQGQGPDVFPGRHPDGRGGDRGCRRGSGSHCGAGIPQTGEKGHVPGNLPGRPIGLSDPGSRKKYRPFKKPPVSLHDFFTSEEYPFRQ